MHRETGSFLEKCRVKDGAMASDKSFGFNGAFFIPSVVHQVTFKVICSDGLGWEHVSVSLPNRCPAWTEMCWIKDQFWHPQETVTQIHPPQSEHINNAKYCLHLWRPVDQAIPLPAAFMVGIKELGTLD